MTTNDEQYVPSDEDVRWQYVVKRMHDGATRTHAEQEYTRWLAARDAHVRRDAAREALDGLINECRTEHEEAATNNRVGGMALELHAQQVAMNYRDTHYPEETP